MIFEKLIQPKILIIIKTRRWKFIKQFNKVFGLNRIKENIPGKTRHNVHSNLNRPLLLFCQTIPNLIPNHTIPDTKPYHTWYQTIPYLIPHYHLEFLLLLRKNNLKRVTKSQKICKIVMRKFAIFSFSLIFKEKLFFNGSPVAEFKEFERRFKFKPRFKYGWFHLKLYQMF